VIKVRRLFVGLRQAAILSNRGTRGANRRGWTSFPLDDHGVIDAPVGLRDNSGSGSGIPGPRNEPPQVPGGRPVLGKTIDIEEVDGFFAALIASPADRPAPKS